MTTESNTRSFDQKEAEQTTIVSTMTSSPATLINMNDPSINAAAEKPQQSENADSDGSGDSDLEEEKVDESQLTPKQLDALRQARREKMAAKKAAKRAKKKKRKQVAKGGGAAGAGADGGDEDQQRQAKQPKTSPQSSPASSPSLSSFTTISAILSKSAVDSPAATFGVASILQHKALRDTVAIDQSKPLISGGGASLTPSPSPSPTVAASQAATSTAASSSTTPAFGMTLDEWRALSAERRELSMTVIGEDVTAAKLAEKRVAIEANRLTGLGGGYKDTTGWICQSYNCTRFENYKNDTVCKRCGAHRRY